MVFHDLLAELHSLNNRKRNLLENIEYEAGQILHRTKYHLSEVTESGAHTSFGATEVFIPFNSDKWLQLIAFKQMEQIRVLQQNHIFRYFDGKGSAFVSHKGNEKFIHEIALNSNYYRQEEIKYFSEMDNV